MTEPDFLSTTRSSYDAVAADYAVQFRDELTSKPWDRAMLAGFAELVPASGLLQVADLGCGPGRVTAHLRNLGLDAFGIDLSPQMVAAARQANPNMRFDEGSMTALNLPDATLGGVVAWYSIIHIPQERLADVFAEFHRVLTPGGHALLAFQAGNRTLHRTDGFGRAISLTSYHRQPDHIAEMLSRAKLAVRATLLREPDDYAGGTESTRQAYLLARKPVA